MPTQCFQLLSVLHIVLLGALKAALQGDAAVNEPAIFVGTGLKHSDIFLGLFYLRVDTLDLEFHRTPAFSQCPLFNFIQSYPLPDRLSDLINAALQLVLTTLSVSPRLVVVSVPKRNSGSPASTVAASVAWACSKRPPAAQNMKNARTWDDSAMNPDPAGVFAEYQNSHDKRYDC
ncbi:hypothetical protein HED54_09045 [Ochrobactrum anthropi ATCC 49188]|nr:hypothetical protein [Brucella anthropi ATCC 49188]